jgi:DnaA-like protein
MQMFNVKDEPQTAEQVWARAQHTQRRIAAQRRIRRSERVPVQKPVTEQELAAQPTEAPKPKPPVPMRAAPLPLHLTALEKIVIRIVAQEYQLDPHDILSTQRVHSVVRPRQIAMWIVKQLSPKRPLPQIGRSFKRDHTTVLHAVRTIDDMRNRGALSCDLLDELVQKCSKETARWHAPPTEQENVS